MWPHQGDSEPRDAAAWAAAKGHHNIVRLFKAAPAPLDSLKTISAETLSICDGAIHTGIKCIDLFAPIPQGGLTKVVAEANAGVVTLLGELSRRWLDSGIGRVIWTGFPLEPIDQPDWEADLDELGVKGSVVFSMGSLAQDEDQRCLLFDSAIASADSGDGETLLVIISNPGFEYYVEASFAKITRNERITCLVVTPKSGAVDMGYFPPYSAQIRLDPIRTKKLLLPAIDPAASDSDMIKELGLNAMRLAVSARALIANYVITDPNLERVFSENWKTESVTARRLIAYLRQPFFVTEPFTGADGEFVSAAELHAELAAIIAH